jgi:hypothetical protein
MATDMLDFASVDAAAGAAAPAADSAVETDITPGAETMESGEEGALEQNKEANADGTPKTEAQKAEAAKAAKTEGAESTPQHIRATLKNLRDSADPNTPEGKATLEAVKNLHGSYERWNAAKQIFPKGVAEMKDAKAFLTEVGGREGYAQTQQVLDGVRESDELLYKGDGKLMDQIVEDLKSEGRLDALGKLAPAFLDKLKEHDSAGYYKSFAPHFLSGLRESQVPQAINGLWKALATGDTETAKEITQGVATWFKGLQDKEQQTKKQELDPERKALADEKKQWETTKTQERQSEIAGEADKYNNRALGTHLKNYLRTPFFKGFTKPNLVPLGNEIKASLFSELKADKAYQTQMKALWGAKSPDKAKITQYHNAKVDSIAERLVRDTVQRMYPGYAKGGSAAGRVAAATAKKETTQKIHAAAAATGKPVYVATKPKWDAIDWEKDPKQLNYIAGRAFLKGSGRLVTWRKP